MKRTRYLFWLLILAACETKKTPPPTPTVVTASASASAKSAPAFVDAAAPASLTREVLADVLATHPEVQALDDLPRVLPKALKRSFVLKHGRDRKGERGHLVETKISQSADPLAPRAILFDEKSGFLVSYNGGLPEQKNGHRLDVHWFDAEKKTFTMEAVEFGPTTKPQLKPSTECASCHGPRGRPIFSMYPDWPGFYGSDNDEITNGKVAVQAAELADYRVFRSDVVGTKKHPRYVPLFQQGDAEDSDRAIESFPFRPDVSEDIHAISRAFAFRPGLRLGILLNRLQARALVEHVTHHKNYEKYGALFLSHLLQCRSPLPAPPKSELDPVLGEPMKVIGDSGLLHYRQLWKLFDLEVRDVDIRYGYGHDGYRSDDASKNPMSIGYVGTYWNSYFDGSATIDELVAYSLYEDQQKHQPNLATVAVAITPNGLTKKYAHLKERFKRDETFFKAMDDKAQWISIPYPKPLHDVHHREGFPAEHKKQHDALCAALR